VTVSETPTPSRANFSAQRAASETPPMVVSAMTTSTGRPLAWRKLEVKKSAVERAIFMVCSSSDSRTPPRRPSMVGRIPILGSEPRKRF
jgi:hypothetical protein